eukprot:UN12269
MGSTHCTSRTTHSCEIVCNCFVNDKTVEDTKVVRYSKSKWIWSHNHESVLNGCLSTAHYNIPKAIILLIKMHSFSAKRHFYISKAMICAEKHYAQINQLLVKRLCSTWYLSQLAKFHSFPIALIDKSQSNGQHLFNSFGSHSLPALQRKIHSNSRNNCHQTTRKTLHINNCQVTINLLNTKWSTLGYH